MEFLPVENLAGFLPFASLPAGWTFVIRSRAIGRRYDVT